MTCLISFSPSLSGSCVNLTPLVSPVSSSNHKKGPGRISAVAAKLVMKNER